MSRRKTIFLSAAGWGHFWKWNENSKHPRLFASVVLGKHQLNLQLCNKYYRKITELRLQIWLRLDNDSLSWPKQFCVISGILSSLANTLCIQYLDFAIAMHLIIPFFIAGSFAKVLLLVVKTNIALGSNIFSSSLSACCTVFSLQKHGKTAIEWKT